jgi:hypothetical protein
MAHFSSAQCRRRYQKQLQRLLAPVWAAAGGSIEVRNAGQGGSCGDTFRNQVWCQRHMLGDDADEAHGRIEHLPHHGRMVLPS